MTPQPQIDVTLSVTDTMRSLGTQHKGLSTDEAQRRRMVWGPNDVADGSKLAWYHRLTANLRNPLIILLAILGVAAFLTGDITATVMIGTMIIIGVVLRYVQEMRSDQAAAQLRARVLVTSTVLRDGAQVEVPIRDIVPGDVVVLAAGDMVPADVVLIESRDLHIDQSVLTGESMPIEKDASVQPDQGFEPLDDPRRCFQASNVQTGSATAVVIATGASTFVGTIAEHLGKERAPTAFDIGIDRFTWLMIRFIAIIAPLVFILNGFSRGDWVEALFFALAIAVGLTPEMLPMIVTVNLAKGAIALAKRKVIIKRLNAIQDLGAIDTLCTDKTGTLTQGHIILVRHVDAYGNDDERVLHMGYLNSYYETGLKNLLDQAVLDHEHLQEGLVAAEGWHKLDEVPFDFERRRLSVLVRNAANEHYLVCKGAVDELLEHCVHVPDGATDVVRDLHEHGFRVVALAQRRMSSTTMRCTVDDEQDLTLVGFLGFLDPPKESAAEALSLLAKRQVDVKILTGDSDVVTLHVCQEVGLSVKGVLLGHDIERMSDAELATLVETTTVFAKVNPMDKERIIRLLRANGHVVGFLGDGINDAPALRSSDVGISVDTAVDIAREASDMILLEQSLLVIHDGVQEGRRVFGNVIKYIRMAASSNFGNMVSVVGASIMLPFLPMLPIQILLNNLLYDFSQTTIPTDRVDDDWLSRPRRWVINDLRRYIVTIGPISSIFDYATFAVMAYALHALGDPAVFRTGWFIESLCTQTLIIHIIRTERIPFIESRASTPLMISSIAIVSIGIWLPFSPLASALGFVAPPLAYWPWLGGIVVCYVVLTQIVKRRFIG